MEIRKLSDDSVLDTDITYMDISTYFANRALFRKKNDLLEEIFVVSDYYIVLTPEEQKEKVQNTIVNLMSTDDDKLSTIMSLLGTAGDSSTLMLILVAAFMKVLNELPSDSGFRDNMVVEIDSAFSKIGGFSDFATESTNYLNSINDDITKTPFILKYLELGIGGLFAEINERNSIVSSGLLSI